MFKNRQWALTNSPLAQHHIRPSTLAQHQSQRQQQRKHHHHQHVLKISSDSEKFYIFFLVRVYVRNDTNISEVLRMCNFRHVKIATTEKTQILHNKMSIINNAINAFYN